MKRPDKWSPLPVGPLETTDKGYSSELAEKDWQALKRDASFARRQGFIDLFKLARILTDDSQYSSHLPRLWEEYKCDQYGARKLNVHKARGRLAAWLKLLDRFTLNELAKALGKSMLEDIRLLPLQGGKEKVALSDLAQYFTEALEIPLPSLLFPSSEDKNIFNPVFGPASKTVEQEKTPSHAPEDEGGEGKGFSHSGDYRSVNLNGTELSLTHLQSAAIEALHEAYKNNTPDLSEAHVLEKIESKSKRLRDVFKGNPDAWKKLIVHGKRKGLFRLNI